MKTKMKQIQEDYELELSRINKELEQVRKDVADGLYTNNDRMNNFILDREHKEVGLCTGHTVPPKTIVVEKEVMKNGYCIYVSGGGYVTPINSFTKKTQRENGIPTDIIDFPIDELPEGWTIKYRGMGWESKGRVNCARLTPTTSTPYWFYSIHSRYCTSGDPKQHYVELIPPPVQEYTMDEIANKLGIPVEQLKIKK